jgi:iron complex outermembrane receptor protein
MYPNLAAFASGTGEEQTVEGTDYSTVLPSFNLAVSLTDDLIARFGASKGLYFPTLDQTRNSKVLALSSRAITQDPTQVASPVNPVVDFSNVQLNGIARNPFLEPEESTNLDLTAEWYFSKTGSLTGTLFHKKIENLFRERQYFENVTNEGAGATESVSFVGPFNEGDGTITGIEVSYTQFFDMLPGAWSGLGIQTNYTYIDQDDLNDPQGDSGQSGIRLDSSGNVLSDDRNSFRAFSNLPLPSYSDKNYNVVGMYEYENISARIAYTWRSEYLVTRRDSNEFAPIYAKAAGYLDASIYYTITDNLKVGIEGSNLLDTITTTQAQFNQAGDKTDSLNFKTDRRYAVSLRATF